MRPPACWRRRPLPKRARRICARKAGPPMRSLIRPRRRPMRRARDSIVPCADPATRTYLAKFSLPGADDHVELGMTATLTLSDPATTRVARLPLSALFDQGDKPSFYVVDDHGDIALKPVKVKSYESNDVVISG